MTLNQRFRNYLTTAGLWGTEPDAVLAEFWKLPEAAELNPDDHDEGYPKELLAALRLSLDDAADKWLAANKPNHFARPQFNAEMQAQIKANIGMNRTHF